ncbi:MAG: hypothetical protein RL318_2975, partial [Fibrobacterota bacterium]|jgi:murein DD-endopeptidase MepM/ murein hydrolase activator NlpD
VILRSSQSPERIREKTEDLRRSNRQLEQHLETIEAHYQSIRSTIETLDEKNRNEALSASARFQTAQAMELDEILDGSGVDSLLLKARTLREAMDKAVVDFERHTAEMISLPTIHPVNRSWPIVETYGPQVDLFTGQNWLQQGVAYATPPGTPIWATGAGIVVDAGTLPRWGMIVEINHGNGFHTIYGHLQSTSVRIGQNILRGQVVGLSGSSGRVTAPRTFYAVFYRRKAMDPSTVLLPPPRPQPGFLDSSLFKLEPVQRTTARDSTGLRKR